MQPECPKEANYYGVVKSLLARILLISQMSDLKNLDIYYNKTSCFA
jgi:hypothetical protein